MNQWLHTLFPVSAIRYFKDLKINVVDTLIAYLENLKNAVPVSCTMFNLQRLKINCKDFRDFLLSLPEYMGEMKQVFLEQLEAFKQKILLLEAYQGDDKELKFAFQQATVEIKQTMDAAIARLGSLPASHR